MFSNILITGSSGFIGSILVNELEKQRYKVLKLDLNDVDLLDKKKTFNYLENKNIDCIVHLAALSNAKKSFSNPEKYMDSGIVGTLNLLEACEKNKIKKFIYMSSLTVHGKNEAEVNENSPTKPKHFYAASKVAGESIVNVFSENSQINSYIFRPNLIMGNNLEYNDLINVFIREIYENDVFTIFGNGKHLRDWIHVKDIVQAIHLAINDLKTRNQTFCIGANRYSTIDLANLIAKKIGKGEPIFKKDNSQAFSLFCNSEKIKKYLNWKPTFSIDKIIDERISLYKKKNKN